MWNKQVEILCIANRNLQNEHLVQLYGVCEQPDLLIVTEFMEEGALLDYLKAQKSHILSQPKMCLEIAKQVRL